MSYNNSLPLILSRETISRGPLTSAKPAGPNVAVVYDTGFGETACFDGRPLRWSKQMTSKYRYRYEVDTGDHRRTAKLENSPLPSQGDAYYFETTVNIGLRVTDPEEVVRRNVTDALVVVYDFLLECFRPIARRHDIHDASGVEAEINQLFQQGPMRLPEGITIFRCVVQVAPDSAARDYIKSLVSAQRQGNVGAAEHILAVAGTQHEQILADMRQTARLGAEAKEHDALAGRPLDLRGLVMAHLAKHPGETAYALDLMLRYEQAQLSQRDVDDQRTLDLFRFMAERDLIQAVDVDRLRTEALGRVQAVAGRDRAPIPPGTGWDEDLPIVPQDAVIRSTAQPAAEPVWGTDDILPQTGSALPVYVVADESESDPAYMAALNRGLQGLGGRLAATPEAIGALRLALLGYAEDVVIRMPMTSVAPDGYLPQFGVRGAARLAGVVESLHTLIPEDVDRLKSRGLTVGRPTVYLLLSAPPADWTGRSEWGDWADGYRRLTDRDMFRYAPNIVVCGVGAVDPALVARLATRPELAFCAPARTPLGEAVGRYTDFLAAGLAQLAQTHVHGKSDTLIGRPAGFRRADEPEGSKQDA